MVSDPLFVGKVAPLSADLGPELVNSRLLTWVGQVAVQGVVLGSDPEVLRHSHCMSPQGHSKHRQQRQLTVLTLG